MILSPEVAELLQPVSRVVDDGDDALRTSLRTLLRQGVDNALIDARRLVALLEDLKKRNP